MVGKDHAAFRVVVFQQQLLQTGSVKYIIPKDKRRFVVPDKLFPDDKCLRKAIGNGLFGITEAAADLAAVTQQFFKIREVIRGGNDQYFPDIACISTERG